MTMRRILIMMGATLVCLAVAWIGFIRWYYYKDEGQELAYLTDEYIDALDFRSTELRQGLYLMQGNGGNVTVLTGSDGVLIVDTDERFLAAKLIDAIEQLGSGPVQYVVNTHAHGDHTGANANFLWMGAEIIAHPNTYASLKNSPEETRESLPTKLVSDGDRMQFNGQTITFIHIPFAHTNGDIAVLFEPANVIATGDMFVANGVPYLSSQEGVTLATHLQAQNALLEHINAETLIVPGHGEISGKQGLIKVHNDLKKTDEYVAFLKRSGVSGRFAPYFHPLYAWPFSLRRGFGWERFWLGIVYHGADDQ